MGGRGGIALPLAVMALVALGWLALGFAVDNSYYQLMMTLVPIWAVMGLSWNILSGYTGLVSFGHAAFFGLGAYTVTILFVRFDLTPWLGVPLGMVTGVVAALVIGYPTFRLRGHYFALAMLAYPLALLYVFEWLGYQEVTLPMKRADPAAYMQFSDYRVYIALALGLLVAALLVSLAVERSRFGRSLLAIKQNEPAAEAAGIDTLAWKMRAITLSGAIASAAGGFYAVVLLVVTPESVFGVLTSAQALVVTLFGGSGTLWGPVIGAVILIPLSETLQAQLGDVIPGIQGVVYGLAIILVILLAPEGIFWRVSDRLGRTRAGESARDRAGRGLPAAAADVRTPLPPLGQPLLEVRELSRSFGGLRAVDQVSFAVEEGAILGIIGPNGAGKTTLFNLLNGFLKPDSGEVVFAGSALGGRKPNRICRLGVGRTFQVVRAFQRMSVLHNVVVGAHVRTSTEDEAFAAAHDALARVGLAERAAARAGSLSNKELRLMELARALAGRPRLLLMDEPLAGLAAGEIEEMLAVVKSLPPAGTTVVIIEHTMRAMMRLAERFVVLNHGRVLAVGRPSEVTADRRVVEAYLGSKWTALHARG
ncbi:MAG TPA: branched-chain amino acid ABC transporter ATP-binding protein/permease [Alphaproteobacteria bacterium]|nr:branched-chain amino acid ABC transporter ATP-binding protein/permease [Alphaproteobacteria bacterium]